MAETKKKYYVVWRGVKPGIYQSWDECKNQITAFPGARYKGFPSRMEAEKAFHSGPQEIKKKPGKKYYPKIEKGDIAVDAACSGNPGIMEYQGVELSTGKLVFHRGPFPKATNNIGEFLAIVHALALLKKNNSTASIYTDSRTGLAWLKKKKVKSELPQTQQTEEIWDLIGRAENWLKANSYPNKVIKWETEDWGEIPADFGRK